MQVDPNHFPVVGHGWAIEQLARAFNMGRNRHAYLLSGAPSIGKNTLATSIAMALNCTAEQGRPCGTCRTCRLIIEGKHPDITLVESERPGATLKIEQIREMQHTIALRPYEARYRVAIINRFHEASNTAPDAILKTLEEPPPHVVIILLTEDASRLLGTIRSRCQPYILQPLRLQEVEAALQQSWDASAEDARLLAHLSGGRIGWAVEALQQPELLDERNQFLDVLESLSRSNRRTRFSEAERLAKQFAKNKGDLIEVLQLWQSYWRDALLLSYGNDAWLTNVDHLPMLEAIVQQQDARCFQQAINATRRATNYINRNVNTRLALETMVLDYPFTR